jgi:TonB family protein
MSPRALLLSPDDQAVSAITGVLEELSVLCERPRDGATAALKLNSQTYDLVLVDCDNLPAAKLIFDVCRRAHAGTTIPIAIVDGRAGLPTAFRLGAELILTKPVAKDQARSTIRTAVSRLRKEEPTRATLPVEPAPAEAPPSIPETLAQAAAAGAASAVAAVPAAVGAVAAPEKTVDSTTLLAPVVADVPKAIPVPLQVAPAAVSPMLIPEASTSTEKAAGVPDVPGSAAPNASPKPPEDSVLAELTKAETELQTPITFSSYDQSKKRKKTRGPLVAVLLLGMAGAGFYAAWTTQPDFRAMVQPQVDKAMALMGIPPAQKNIAPAQTAQPVVKAPVTQTPVPTQSVPATTAAPPVPENTSQPAPATTAAATGTLETASPAPAPIAKATPTANDDSEATKSKQSAATAPTAELPWEKETVILSSKGAEKRLVHQVQPAYPKEARSQKADGTVVLKTLVGGDGSVEGIRLVEGNPALASAATKAVKQWRYKPYIRDGSRTPFQTIVIVDFQQP